MSPTQFKKALTTLDLSQAGFARLVGSSPRHVNRWAVGDGDMPRSVEIILKLLVSGKLKPRDIEGVD